MKVRVKSGRVGYYGLQRRREGDVFEIEKNEDFSEKWMEAVDGPAPVKPTAEKAKGSPVKPTADKTKE
jgi:hypothetical protein